MSLVNDLVELLTQNPWFALVLSTVRKKAEL